MPSCAARRPPFVPRPSAACWRRQRRLRSSAAVPATWENVGGWLDRRARIAPDRLAIVDGERRLAYRELAARTARLSGWLQQQGVARGDRVALLLTSRSAYLEAVFACARIAAIAVPVNARLAPPEIAHILGDCTPRVLLYDDGLVALAAASLRGLAQPPLRQLAVGGSPDAYEAALASAPQAAQAAAVGGDDPMLLLYTSGTTGQPKGALLPHRKTLFNSLNAAIFFDLTQHDRVLVPLPLFHSFGLVILSIPALYAGATVVLERSFDPHAVWQRVRSEGITFFGAVPTQLRELLAVLDQAGREAVPVAGLRFLFSAGAALPVEVIRGFERHGLVVKQGFGQTETSILCCLDGADALRKAGSVGRPVFHAEVRVVRQDGLAGSPEIWQDCAPGETGEIVVRGPITMLGYWRQPDATRETLRDEWLRTGDLAMADEEGFLTLVGRARELYISGGENVYPAQVEAVYATHPEIAEIAVVGVPDPYWGEVGRAFVVLAPGARLDPDSLRAWGAERLARYKLPRSFVAVDSLPRTVTGKVQKHRLG